MTILAVNPTRFIFSGKPGLTSGYRLCTTLVCAILAHALVIFGVSFVPNEPPKTLRNTLEIVLVHKRHQPVQQDAEMLAQANQEEAGKNTDTKRHLKSRTLPVNVNPSKMENSTSFTNINPPPVDDQAGDSQEVLTKVADTKNRPLLKVNPLPQKKPNRPATDITESAPELNAARLIKRSLAMASLSAEIDQRLAAYSERPRRKWVSAKTREYKYATYMHAWRVKIERIGNLNYPDEARKRKLSGHLLLDVALNADGTINEIILRRSSGHQSLDEAAINIVKLAAPFSPLPKGILEDTDILHIERTWRFMTGSHFSSQ